MSEPKDIVYCIDVGVYGMHLTLNKSYQVVARNQKKGQTRIKGDSGRLVWISDYYLNDTLSPEFELWLESENWADENDWDPKNDFMNVQVKLPDGRCYNLNIWTYNYFNARVEETVQKKGSNKNYIIPPDLFVEELSRERICEVVSDMLRYDSHLDEAVHDPVFSMELPDSWIDAYELPDLGESLENELKLELDQGHPLYGKELTAMAKRQGNDDVLFSYDKEKLALVHLTWSGKKEQGKYPKTQIFYNMKHFWEMVIKDGVHEISGLNS